MPQKELPKVTLVSLGMRTTKGKMVDADFLRSIYLQGDKSDEANFRTPAKEEIEWTKRELDWLAIENSEGEVVGATSVTLKDARFKDRPLSWKIAVPNLRGEVARTLILPKFRGKGYAAASKIMIEGIAREAGVKRLFAHVHRKNLKSRNAIKKAGFKPRILENVKMALPNLLRPTLRKETLKGNPLIAFSKRIRK